MKKLLTITAIGILLFASCSKIDFIQEPNTTDSTPTGATQEDINANVQKVFGTTFDPNHEWCSTENGQVTITANSSVQKVQVIVYVSEMGLDDEEVTSMRILNEAELDGNTTVTLNYDAPKDNLGIYVAFINGNKKSFKKVEGNAVNITDAAKTRGDGDWGLPEALGLTLPTGEYKIAGSINSYANERGWIPGEQLYYLSDEDYNAQGMKAPGYSKEFTDLFRALVFSYFKNGRSYNNIPLVKGSGYYNDKAYPFTTGDQPIIVSPVYKCDQAKKWGNEIWNSDLYYYYFNDADIAGMTKEEEVAFLESLPKYKALAFKDYFGETEDDKIRKDVSYALLYFEDTAVGTIGTYKFPKGMKIGFMVRAKTDFIENGKARKQGELYGDGRLNNMINKYSECNFKSSGLGEDGPRLAYLSFNDRKYMCWESGTDCDFNDVILEVEGGIDIPEIPIDPEYNKYTYCFEDTPIGDYDMNDVVIKAVRKNQTTVEYYITACGAYDEIYIKGINKDLDEKEVHFLLTKSTNTKVFINTEKGGKKVDAIKVTKTVDKGFSLIDPNTAPYLYDATTKVTVLLSKKGESPHGIMIPNDFKYPLERVCIKDAYLEFNNWGQNYVTSTEWYKKPVSDKVYE